MKFEGSRARDTKNMVNCKPTLFQSFTKHLGKPTHSRSEGMSSEGNAAVSISIFPCALFVRAICASGHLEIKVQLRLTNPNNLMCALVHRLKEPAENETHQSLRIPSESILRKTCDLRHTLPVHLSTQGVFKHFFIVSVLLWALNRKPTDVKYNSLHLPRNVMGRTDILNVAVEKIPKLTRPVVVHADSSSVSPSVVTETPIFKRRNSIVTFM
jgi:hypothetical protein